MYTNLDLLTFILAFVVIAMGLHFVRKSNQADVFKQRLKDLHHHQNILTGQQDQNKNKAYQREPETEPNPYIKILKKIQFTSHNEQEKIKLMFEKAGWRSDYALTFYMIAKLFAIFPPAIGTYIYIHHFTKWSILSETGAILGAALLGSYAIDKFLGMSIRRRQENIQRAFPDALDLMVICTEAGLSLNTTMQRVAREISQISPDLGYELALTSIELNLLPDRKAALQNFSNRLDLPSFRGMISTLIQSEQYGTPIAQTMRVIAEEFRAERLLHAEEKAARLPILLTLPLAFFILPCIFIVILGPAAMSIIAAFK